MWLVIFLLDRTREGQSLRIQHFGVGTISPLGGLGWVRRWQGQAAGRDFRCSNVFRPGQVERSRTLPIFGLMDQSIKCLFLWRLRSSPSGDSLYTCFFQVIDIMDASLGILLRHFGFLYNSLPLDGQRMEVPTNKVEVIQTRIRRTVKDFTSHVRRGRTYIPYPDSFSPAHHIHVRGVPYPTLTN